LPHPNNLVKSRWSRTKTFINTTGPFLSNIFYIRSFRGANCDTGNYLVVAKVRDRLPVSKIAAQKFDIEMLNLRKLNELKVSKEYHINVSYRFVALGNLNESEDINSAWENIKGNIKTSAKESLGPYELKQPKSRHDEEY